MEINFEIIVSPVVNPVLQQNLFVTNPHFFRPGLVVATSIRGTDFAEFLDTTLAFLELSDFIGRKDTVLTVGKPSPPSQRPIIVPT